MIERNITEREMLASALHLQLLTGEPTLRMSADVVQMLYDQLTRENEPTFGGWISVMDQLPEEHESIFHKYLGTPMWSSAMWQQESDKALVYVSFPDGTSVVTTGCLHNSDWMTTVSKALPQTVTHWMPLPEPPGR